MSKYLESGTKLHLISHKMKFYTHTRINTCTALLLATFTCIINSQDNIEQCIMLSQLNMYQRHYVVFQGHSQ